MGDDFIPHVGFQVSEPGREIFVELDVPFHWTLLPSLAGLYSIDGMLSSDNREAAGPLPSWASAAAGRRLRWRRLVGRGSRLLIGNRWFGTGRDARPTDPVSRECADVGHDAETTAC